MNIHLTSQPTEVDLAQLFEDPYPIYAALRRDNPVPFVAQANRYLVLRFADVVALEKDPETFKADEDGSLMKRVMGHTMLRKDGAAHRRERVACEASLRPGIIKSHWMVKFAAIADDLIDQMEGREEVDIFDDFAAPMASRALAELLGLTNVAPEELGIWSQAMMDGTGNYGNDPEIWARSEAASAGVDKALDAAIARVSANPDPSLVSSMLHAEDPLDLAAIRANVKVIIGGGLNEPRDAIATAVTALLENPDQRALVAADPSLWRQVFEETVRWVSPIGMYPRQVTKDTVLGGVALPAGAKIGVVLAAANRDPAQFENPDQFDIRRTKKPHVAFGGGPHFCLGTWAARAMVGEIALPRLFTRLEGLRAAGRAKWAGWVFRGPISVPVRFDRVAPRSA